MLRTDVNGLPAMPNFIHFIHEIHKYRSYTLYLKDWGKKLQYVSVTAKRNSEWHSYSLRGWMSVSGNGSQLPVTVSVVASTTCHCVIRSCCQSLSLCGIQCFQSRCPSYNQGSFYHIPFCAFFPYEWICYLWIVFVSLDILLKALFTAGFIVRNNEFFFPSQRRPIIVVLEDLFCIV
jgi:hypothetical protein